MRRNLMLIGLFAVALLKPGPPVAAAVQRPVAAPQCTCGDPPKDPEPSKPGGKSTRGFIGQR